MPDEHAVLGPSAAERWITCPASVRMAAKVPDSTSTYAEEGTHAHTLGELKARRRFHGMTDYAYSVEWRQWLAKAQELGYDANEMSEHADAYVEYIAERVAEHDLSQVLLEQRVFTGIEGCWGTADCVIISPDHVEVIDLKYGAGVKVSAVRNPQLMLYGVGALEQYGDLLGDTRVVKVSVFQPRMDNYSTYELPAAELREWRDGLMPIAEAALGDHAEFGPSEVACRWCPAAGICRARVEALTLADFGPPNDPDVLTPEELGDYLGRIPAVKAWCAAVEDAALDRIYSQSEEVPGWKVVLSGGIRKVTDPKLAEARLVEAGVNAEDIYTERKLLGVGALDKLVGGTDKLWTVLGDALTKTDGKPSLAPEDDPRPAASPSNHAVQEFSELQE